MDKEVTYHRTFLDPWAIYGGNVPVWISPKIMAGDKGVHTAYTVRDRHLVQILIREKKDQDFYLYATAWELEWSKLVYGSHRVTPLVDQNLRVVGYCGWIDEPNIFVPSDDYSLRLEERLRNGEDVFVAAHSPSSRYDAIWLKQHSTRLSERSWFLMMGIHGNVLLSFGSKNTGYLETSWVTPVDLWEGIKLVVSLAGALRGKIVATLASKSSRSVANGLFRELTKEELETVRGGSRLVPAKNTIVVGRGATTGRSSVPDVGIPKTMAPARFNPDYPVLLRDAVQKYPQLKGQIDDLFVERIGVNPNPPPQIFTMGFTPADAIGARDLLQPQGTLRILQNPIGGATFDSLEKDIRDLISTDFTISKVERLSDGLLITATKK